MIKILDIKLEDFTTDPKTYSKIILKFCDIEASEDILSLNDSNSFISKTSSFFQIRQKIQNYNNNKYKPYYFLFKK